MALINTTERGKWIGNKSELVRTIRLALAEELAATNTYADLAESIRQMGNREVDESGQAVVIPPNLLSKTEADAIAKRIDEIQNDELNHTGKLIKLIEELDTNSEQQMTRGAAGA